MTDWDIEGKTVLLTGGTTGIGRATVDALARRGASVIFTARRADDGDRVTAEVKRASGNDDVSYRELHLDDLASVRTFAASVQDDLDRLDVLVNNAGITVGERRTTADGFESMFGVNHLGHFLLVEELRPLLAASAPARIVVVASDAHKMGGPLDFDDLQGENARFGVVGGMRAYGRSKLANMLHVRELSERLNDTGVEVFAVHPGFVRTRLGRDSEAHWFAEKLIWPLVGRMAKTPEEGAETSVYAITSPELAGKSGTYLAEGKPATPNKLAQDHQAARRLWEASERLVG